MLSEPNGSVRDSGSSVPMWVLIWLILYSKWDDSNSNSTSEPVKHSNNVLKKLTSTQNDTLCAADTRIITKEKNNK